MSLTRRFVGGREVWLFEPETSVRPSRSLRIRTMAALASLGGLTLPCDLGPGIVLASAPPYGRLVVLGLGSPSRELQTFARTGAITSVVNDASEVESLLQRAKLQ